MKKCYITGKITGLLESEYRSNFERAKKEVAGMGYEPVSPVDLPHLHARSWSDYMQEDLIAMLKCDCVYALRNWASSAGATIEIGLAESLNMKIINQP